MFRANYLISLDNIPINKPIELEPTREVDQVNPSKSIGGEGAVNKMGESRYPTKTRGEFSQLSGPVKHNKLIDISGQRFGKLVVQHYVGSQANLGEGKRGRSAWLCLCDQVRKFEFKPLVNR